MLRSSQRLGLSVRQTKRYPGHCRWQDVVDMRVSWLLTKRSRMLFVPRRGGRVQLQRQLCVMSPCHGWSQHRPPGSSRCYRVGRSRWSCAPMPQHCGTQVPRGVMSTWDVGKGALQLQTSRIIGQHGGSWAVAMTCALFVQRMPPPRSMTNSKQSSQPRTSLSPDMEWHPLRAI